jgi:hypothetical protein
VASHVYPVQSRQEFEADCDFIRWIGQAVEAAGSMDAASDMIREQYPQRLEEGLEMAGWFMEGLRREKEK